MRQLFVSAMVTMAMIFSSFAGGPAASQPNSKEKKTFILVHGAWMAPYAWKTVSEELQKKGYKVIVVELPGHGDDHTAPQTLTLDVYKDKVIAAMNTVEGKIILVGHSLAGMVISAVAEQMPEKIEKLIYVGAFLPASGQSLLDLANTDAAALLGPSLIPSNDKLTLDVKHENIINIFCADATPAVQKIVLEKFRAEPAIPFTNPVILTDANFGKVDKYYIHTMLDHAVSIDLQNRMVAAASIKNVYALNSSHTPFLSMPKKLTDLLLSIAR